MKKYLILSLCLLTMQSSYTSCNDKQQLIDELQQTEDRLKALREKIIQQEKIVKDAEEKIQKYLVDYVKYKQNAFIEERKSQGKSYTEQELKDSAKQLKEYLANFDKTFIENYSQTDIKERLSDILLQNKEGDAEGSFCSAMFRFYLISASIETIFLAQLLDQWETAMVAYGSLCKSIVNY